MVFTDEMKKDFVHFLKKHNAYGKYRKAFFEQRMYVLNPFNLIDDSLSEQINYSFTWSKTKEGQCFWGKLDEKWRKFCKEKNIECVEVVEDMWS